MTKLSEIQSLLLATAAGRASGSLLPVPTGVTNVGARVTKALAALVRHGLADERDASGEGTTWRVDDDRARGLYITAAGLAAIGVEPAAAPAPDPDPAPAARAPRTTKAALVLDLLRREGGATPAELIAATGWLPHTTRAALTGLRRQGHAIARGTRDGATCYRVAEAG